MSRSYWWPFGNARSRFRSLIVLLRSSPDFLRCRHSILLRKRVNVNTVVSTVDVISSWGNEVWLVMPTLNRDRDMRQTGQGIWFCWRRLDLRVLKELMSAWKREAQVWSTTYDNLINACNYNCVNELMPTFEANYYQQNKLNRPAL